MKLVKQSSITFASISPAQVCDYISKHPDIVILDVRSKDEYEGKTDTFGTLKNAVNIPVQELEGRVGELKDAKDKEIIVYCSYSKRSPRASYFLSTNGFTHVINMDGGMSAMQDGRCKK
jgi:rhodanese-related sulfurtransferase